MPLFRRYRVTLKVFQSTGPPFCSNPGRLIARPGKLSGNIIPMLWYIISCARPLVYCACYSRIRKFPLNFAPPYTTSTYSAVRWITAGMTWVQGARCTCFGKSYLGYLAKNSSRLNLPRLRQEHASHRYLRRILAMAHPLPPPVFPLIPRHRWPGRPI
jgi:hypothetical protein